MVITVLQVLIKQYGQRRLQELGAHKRRKQQLEHQQPGLADAARLITDVMQPTCDVIPLSPAHHGDETLPRSGGGFDHVTRRTPGAAVGMFQQLGNTGNGHIVSYLPLNDIRGNSLNSAFYSYRTCNGCGGN